MMYNSDCNIEEYELPSNGLKIVSDFIPGKNSVSLSLWVKTGSRSENESVNGIAHFLEHMAFKSTTNNTTKEISEIFDKIGGRFNACTGREYTIYYTYVLKEHLDVALSTIADILVNSLFLENEINLEKGVVLQEIAHTNDDPSDIIFDKHMEAAYPNQSFGRSILGPPDNVKSFTKENLKDFVNKHYFAKNMMLVVAGGVDHEEIHSISEKYLNIIPSTSSVTQNIVEKAVYCNGSENKCFISRKELEQVNLILSMNGIDSSDINRSYKIKILSNILGGGMSSRLFQEVRENRGLAYSISSFNSSYSDTGLFTIYSATRPSDIPELLNVVINEMKKIIDDGITDDEFNRTISQLKANILMSFDSISSRADKLGNNFILYNRYITQEETLSLIKSISKKDIQSELISILSQKLLPTISAIGNLEYIPNYDEVVKNILSITPN